MKYTPDIILVDSMVEHLPSTHNILSKFKDVYTTVIDDVRAIKRPTDFTSAKKMMLLTAHNGVSFKPCQGISPEHLCCNYWIIDLISNCPMDCSYCILQSYLANNPLLTIYTNIDEILTKASTHFAKHKDKKFRVGTGELSDSLALDHITGFSAKLIEYFSMQKNVLLELKTKTTNVNHLLKLNHNERTVIAWSVNHPDFIANEEINTSKLDERFAAAQKVIDAGYKVSFHFDPIVFSPTWEDDYKKVAEEIVSRFVPEKIAWISLGTLRFPSDMKDIVLKRFPDSKIFYGEMIPSAGKTRYFRPIREVIYKKMLEYLAPLKEKTPIYLCMETPLVWSRIDPEIGQSNGSIEAHVCRNISGCQQNSCTGLQY